MRPALGHTPGAGASDGSPGRQHLARGLSSGHVLGGSPGWTLVPALIHGLQLCALPLLTCSVLLPDTS